MPTVSRLQIKGHEISEDKEGYKANHVFQVYDLTGSEEQRLLQALQHPNIPKRGDPHPALPEIVVVDRRATPLGEDNQQAEVSITYETPDPDELQPADGAPARVRIGSGVTTEQTNSNLNGEPILTTVVIDDATDDGAFFTRTEDQVHDVDVERPASTAIFERTESESPLEKSRIYVGTINLSTWTGGGPGTWLCRGSEGDSDDGGQTYKVAFTFQYKPTGGNPVVRASDPDTGLPVFGSLGVSGIGSVAVASVYPMVSFAQLNLGPETGSSQNWFGNFRSRL